MRVLARGAAPADAKNPGPWPWACLWRSCFLTFRQRLCPPVSAPTEAALAFRKKAISTISIIITVIITVIITNISNIIDISKEIYINL